MRLLPKSIHRCHRYPTKFNSGRDFPTRNGGSANKALQLNLRWRHFLTVLWGSCNCTGPVLAYGERVGEGLLRLGRRRLTLCPARL